MHLAVADGELQHLWPTLPSHSLTGCPGVLVAAVLLLASCGDSKMTACAGPQCRIKPGAEHEFVLDMNYMHLFDKRTGAACL